ncbi:hypothetical protein INT44_001495 [Umbelopsis vinacea]|uniref:Uncharacterized protein n=1 Tax=Umbelopsis vinacea TaxID=44442 RepID=A0A8H7PR24_9FUNG|nr:hypothetical protein INT44_001495 [Umbelopsis vinacea]
MPLHVKIRAATLLIPPYTKNGIWPFRGMTFSGGESSVTGTMNALTFDDHRQNPPQPSERLDPRDHVLDGTS